MGISEQYTDLLGRQTIIFARAPRRPKGADLDGALPRLIVLRPSTSDKELRN